MIDLLIHRPYGAWRFVAIALAAILAWRFAPARHQATDRWKRTLAATWALAAIWWIVLTVLRWNAMAHDYDLSHLAGVLHQTAKGRFFHSTHLGFSLLAQHLYLSHLLYLPLLEIFHSPFTLQLGQTLSILGGSLALGRWAANRSRDAAWGWAVALVTILHPAATGIAFSDYDPASIGFLATALALWWADIGFRRTALAALLVAFGSKEIFAPGGIVYGVALALAARSDRSRRRDGLVVALLGLVVLAGWILLRPPMLPPYDQAANFRQRFSWMGPNGVDLAGLVATVATPSKAGYLLHLLLPLALLPLRAPVLAAFALPEVGINLLAGFGMTGMALHYHYATLVGLVASAASAAEGRPRARNAMLAAGATAAILAINSPFSMGLSYARSLPEETRTARERYEAMERLIPPDARVGVVGSWRPLLYLWDRDIATPLPYAGASPRDVARERDYLVIEGTVDTALVEGRVEIFRQGDLGVFKRSGER